MKSIMLKCLIQTCQFELAARTQYQCDDCRDKSLVTKGFQKVCSIWDMHKYRQVWVVLGDYSGGQMTQNNEHTHINEIRLLQTKWWGDDPQR